MSCINSDLEKQIVFLASLLILKKAAIPAGVLAPVEYGKVIRDGLAYHEALPPLPCKAKQGRQPRRERHNLLLRLFHYNQDVLRFLYDAAVFSGSI